MNDSPDFIRPLRAQMYVERVVETHWRDTIIIKPETFAQTKRFSAREKFNAIPDYYLAKVLAVGPEERSGLQPGDHTMVWSYADGDGSVLYSGKSVGERGRLFINGYSGPEDTERCDHLNLKVDL